MKTKKLISKLKPTLLSFINLTSDGAFFTHISDWGRGGGSICPPPYFWGLVLTKVRLYIVFFFIIVGGKFGRYIKDRAIILVT